MNVVNCPLCSSYSESYYSDKGRTFLRCSNCLSVFLHPSFYISATEEKAHYKTHDNNPFDILYQNFVSPIVNSILNDFTAKANGLDFGSGTGSPIVKMLTDKGYKISQYDLFFHNSRQLLQQNYDYIACCEVAEHFKNPHEEFKLLRSLLLPGGRLYIMTELFNVERYFATWYYKNDPTHVFLYHNQAFEWIKQEFGFKNLAIDKRLIILSL